MDEAEVCSKPNGAPLLSELITAGAGAVGTDLVGEGGYSREGGGGGSLFEYSLFTFAVFNTGVIPSKKLKK